MLTPSELTVLVDLLGNTLKVLEALSKDLFAALGQATSATFTRALVAETLAMMLETRSMDPSMRVAALFLLYALYRQTDAPTSNSQANSALVPDHPFLPLLYSLLDTEDAPPDAISIETYFMARFCQNPLEAPLCFPFRATFCHTCLAPFCHVPPCFNLLPMRPFMHRGHGHLPWSAK